MSASKMILLAMLAFVLSLASTVAAADLIDPGKPLNCTAFIANCKKLVIDTHGKTSSPSSQCNVTNLSAAKPLCGKNVICLAIFESKGNSTVPAPVTPTSAAAATPSGNATAAPTGAAPAPVAIPGALGFVTIDMTEQILALYDTSKCGNAAVAKAATSIGALLIIASVVSFMSNML
ncbi:hypothetical protein BGZ70_001352 [Mortierella alpina]|uniref:Uncharacterized protein n=1 Tax=Mortierella alpina TaxID=64518 RepID=A0A9P6JER3_MORAP|nr:hypothetical protein BGZ70_001352 [Mortierella alpina]